MTARTYRQQFVNLLVNAGSLNIPLLSMRACPTIGTPRKLWFRKDNAGKEADSMNRNQIFGIAGAVAALVVGMLLPPMGGLTQLGIRTLGMLAAFLILRVTEALPVLLICLGSCALMPVLGITPSFGKALTGFSQPIVFFILASFGIAAALTSIPLSRRLLRLLLRCFGRNVGQVLLSLMACCAALSSIVSNVPTCAIFMTIALDFVELYENEDDRRRTARAFLIAIPVASMIGGMMTPAGSSINLLAMSQLELHTGLRISFVQWMAAGIPLALVMIPLAWVLMCRIYKPAPVTAHQVERFVAEMDIPEKMDGKERKVCAVTVIMLVLWIASSWIRSINVMVVAMLGCCVMFLPGVEVLDVKTFVQRNSWDAFFLVGSVVSIAGAVIDNGVSDVIAGALPALNVSLPVLLAFAAGLLFITLLVIPNATSLIPIMAVPLITIAAGAGRNPALIMLCAGLCAANCYLLPLDTVPLITYAKGYYSMTDMARSTVFLQLAMVILCPLWLTVLAPLFL